MAEITQEIYDQDVADRSTRVAVVVGHIATPLELIANVRAKASDFGRQILAAIGQEV